MEALVCKHCGASGLIRKSDHWFCPYCESRYAFTQEEKRSLFQGGSHAVLSHSGVNSSIALNDDVERLLEKCRLNPKQARKYANLVLDIDPDNKEALRYLYK